MSCKWCGLACLFVFSATSMVFGQEEWSQFRGGQLQGAYERGEAPASLDDSKLKWAVDVPEGHSSPVVRQGKVFVTSAEQDTNTVTTHCFSLETGETLWNVSEKVDEWERIHDFNSHATPTCCCDAGGVLSYFGSYGLIRYSNDGKKIWEARIPITEVQYGVSTSPVVTDDHVFLLKDSRQGSSLSCYSLGDGQLVWETERPLNSTNNSTPLIVHTRDHRNLIAVNGTPVSHVYDAATGEAVFWNSGFPFEAISVPLLIDDKIIFSNRGTGSPGDPLSMPSYEELTTEFSQSDGGGIDLKKVPDTKRLILRPEVEAGGAGREMPLKRLLQWFMDKDRNGVVDAAEFQAAQDKFTSNRNKIACIGLQHRDQVENEDLEWLATRGVPEMANPIEFGSNIFTIEDGGICNLIAADDGRLIKKTRLRNTGRYTASPIRWNDQVYVISSVGEWSILSADGGKLKTLASGELEDRVFATPAATELGLLVRTEKSLRLYGE
ncbi:MAG: PQQ-binding-like beta-propeller repeat protein [Rubripirellula sp.]|nr:PQQ-binding-like beta-propeller repeat protein [Rubripirellula sp.]